VLQVVQVRLAQEVFVLGEGGGTSLGLFYAVGGLGTGLGPILARRFTGDRPKELRRAIAVAYGLAITGLLVMAPLATLPIVLLGSFLRTFGGGINWVFSTHLLMQTVPSQVRGRVFSTEFALFTLAMAIGTGAGGWVLDMTPVSISQVILGVAGVLLVPGVFWSAWVLTRSEGRQRLS
jgi:predicted MFS family arabinose efflux permease